MRSRTDFVLAQARDANTAPESTTSLRLRKARPPADR